MRAQLFGAKDNITENFMKKYKDSKDNVGFGISKSTFREAFPKEEATILAQAEVLQRENPKVVVLFNKHYPLEPLSEAVNLIRSSYLPKDVLFMEVPFARTPLGEALANYEFLVNIIVEMANGETSLNQYSAKQTTQFSVLLTKIVEKVFSQQNDIARKHQEGFLAGELYWVVNKGVRAVLNPYLKELTSSLIECAGIDYGGMLRALRRLAPYVPEEELLILELSRRFPLADYVSLHGGFVVPLQYQESIPVNHVYANELSFARHETVFKELRGNEYYRTIWALRRHTISSQRLRRELDLKYFEHHVRYADMELPLGCSPECTSAIEKGELIKAIIASFILPSPYLGMDVDDQMNLAKDMDYFRETVMSDEHRALLAQDISEYLDLMLRVSEWRHR